MSIRYDFKLLQGETLSGRVFAVVDTNGLAVDLSGASGHMSVRKHYSDTNPLLDLTTENGGLILNDIAGTVEPRATHTAIAAFTPLNGVYDLFVLLANNTRLLVSNGVFSVSASATRDP